MRITTTSRASYLLLLIALLSLSSCYSFKQSRLRQHVVRIDGRGRPLNILRSKQALPDSAFQQHITNMLNRIKAHPADAHGKKQVMFFIHGGLNSQRTSMDRADRICDSILQAGYYPIFINWTSDFFSSYGEQMFYVRQGYRARFVQFLYSFPILITDLLKGYAGLLFTGLNAMYTDAYPIKKYKLDKIPKIDFYPIKYNGIVLYNHLYHAHQTQPDSTISISLGTDERKFKQRIGRTVSYVTAPFSNTVMLGMIDGLGTPSWENLIRRTRTIMRTPEEFDIRDIRNDPAAIEQHLEGNAKGALSVFLDRLTATLGEDSTYAFTLVGHSMGAMVADQILFNYKESLHFDNIVYMAAASSITDFQNYTIPYLQHHQTTHFHNLTLHPVAETREVYWWAGDLIPRGSLLVWIDNFLESPETFLDRTLGRWDNILQATHIIPQDVRSRVTIKGFGVGTNSYLNPQSHSSFTQSPFWRPDFWKVDSTKTAP